MGSEDECTTQGLDDLDKRCQQYKVNYQITSFSKTSKTDPPKPAYLKL